MQSLCKKEKVGYSHKPKFLSKKKKPPKININAYTFHFFVQDIDVIRLFKTWLFHPSFVALFTIHARLWIGRPHDFRGGTRLVPLGGVHEHWRTNSIPMSVNSLQSDATKRGGCILSSLSQFWAFSSCREPNGALFWELTFRRLLYVSVDFTNFLQTFGSRGDGAGKGRSLLAVRDNKLRAPCTNV